MPAGLILLLAIAVVAAAIGIAFIREGVLGIIQSYPGGST